MDQSVVFKGIRDGLLVLLPNLPIDEALQAMIEKMEQNKSFFDSGACPVFLSGTIDDWTLNQLRQVLLERFNITRVELAGQSRQAEVQVRQQNAEAADLSLKKNGLSGKEALALTIHGTVRNGQKVTYQGDLIILGDSNPGSQLDAGGSVLVLGSLRGGVHAGAFGDESATVAAFSLLPTQIRIASFIARPPEGLKKKEYPEIARVREQHIEITAYLPSRANSGGFK